MSEDLKFISTEDLVDELLSRCETGVIGLSRPHKTEADLRTYKLRWKGNGFVAAGVASAIIDDINLYRRENEDKINEDDF